MTKKGEKMQKILDFVGDRVVDIFDICESFLETPYGASSEFGYRIDKKQEKRFEERRKRDERRESQRKIKKYLWKLKKDGLIKNNDGEISLTEKGESKLKEMNLTSKNNYKIQRNKSLIIVSFDIPEIFKKERDWFRDVLKILGFEMIHQSTWKGKNKIPMELIEDLEEFKILEFVDIFEVKGLGTLSKYREKIMRKNN